MSHNIESLQNTAVYSWWRHFDCYTASLCHVMRSNDCALLYEAHWFIVIGSFWYATTDVFPSSLLFWLVCVRLQNADFTMLHGTLYIKTGGRFCHKMLGSCDIKQDNLLHTCIIINIISNTLNKCKINGLIIISWISYIPWLIRVSYTSGIFDFNHSLHFSYSEVYSQY